MGEIVVENGSEVEWGGKGVRDSAGARLDKNGIITAPMTNEALQGISPPSGVALPDSHPGAAENLDSTLCSDHSVDINRSNNVDVSRANGAKKMKQKKTPQKKENERNSLKEKKKGRAGQAAVLGKGSNTETTENGKSENSASAKVKTEKAEDRHKKKKIGGGEGKEGKEKKVGKPKGPPKKLYKQIKSNKFTHRKRFPEQVSICDCFYIEGFSECANINCVNHMMHTECHPKYCGCGEMCKNQRFQKREYAEVETFLTDNRGWGVKATCNLPAGTFIVEYVGEVIPYAEALERARCVSDGNYYILNINALECVDARHFGNFARFINHSCDPNCIVQQWNVNGELRMGIFAWTDIIEGEELTFDYNWESIGKDVKKCNCGATNCRKYFGAKKQKEEKKAEEKSTTGNGKTGKGRKGLTKGEKAGEKKRKLVEDEAMTAGTKKKKKTVKNGSEEEDTSDECQIEKKKKKRKRGCEDNHVAVKKKKLSGKSKDAKQVKSRKAQGEEEDKKEQSEKCAVVKRKYVRKEVCNSSSVKKLAARKKQEEEEEEKEVEEEDVQNGRDTLNGIFSKTHVGWEVALQSEHAKYITGESLNNILQLSTANITRATHPGRCSSSVFMMRNIRKVHRSWQDLFDLKLCEALRHGRRPQLVYFQNKGTRNRVTLDGAASSRIASSSCAKGRGDGSCRGKGKIGRGSARGFTKSGKSGASTEKEKEGKKKKNATEKKGSNKERKLVVIPFEYEEITRAGRNWWMAPAALRQREHRIAVGEGKKVQWGENFLRAECRGKTFADSLR